MANVADFDGGDDVTNGIKASCGCDVSIADHAIVSEKLNHDAGTVTREFKARCCGRTFSDEVSVGQADAERRFYAHD